MDFEFTSLTSLHSIPFPFWGDIVDFRVIRNLRDSNVAGKLPPPVFVGGGLWRGRPPYIYRKYGERTSLSVSSACAAIVHINILVSLFFFLPTLLRHHLLLYPLSILLLTSLSHRWEGGRSWRLQKNPFEENNALAGTRAGIEVH